MKRIPLVLFFLVLSLCGYSQCITVNISSSSPVICSGSPVVLTASVSGGAPGYSYAWSTGETTAAITVNKDNEYRVTVTDQNNCVQQSSITIASNPTPGAPAAGNTSGVVCYNASAKLVASGSGGTYQWYDAPAGGNFLADGDTYFTPAITESRTFYVQTTVGGCASARTAVFVPLVGNPTGKDVTICANSVATLSGGGADAYRWYDAPSGGSQVGTGSSFVTPVLTSTTIYYLEGTTNGCTTGRLPVRVTVTAAPAAPVVPAYTICTGSAVTLQAGGVSGAVYDWFDAPTGGEPIISSADFTTPVLNANRTYYVQATVGSCPGPRTAVNVTVNPVLPAPVATGNGPVCPDTQAQLTITNPGAGSYQWFTSVTSATPVFTGTVFNTPNLTAATTYYVRRVNGPCISELTAVNVTLRPGPDAPAVTGAQLICNGSSAILTASAPGGTYAWYTVASGGTPVFTGEVYHTPVLNDGRTYYVQTTVDGCVSARRAVTVTVLPLPAAPTVTAGSTCPGGSVTLVADGGDSYQWFATENGGTALASGKVFSTPPLTSTTTYYVQNTTTNGCISNRTAVTAVVTPPPAAPTVTGPGAPVCPGTTAQLTASGSTGSYQWYNAATGGNLLASTAAYSPAVSQTTTFYAQTVSTGGCISDRTAITVTVISTDVQFKYSTGTYCKTSANPTPTKTLAGGTFSAAPAGLIIDPSTGTIDIAGSAINDYIITYTVPGACTVSQSARLSLVTTPNATFSYANTTYCQDGNNPSPQFIPNVSSGGIFTASPAGLVFMNPSTGQINLRASAPGTYTVRNRIDGDCARADGFTTVTIFQRIIVDAGADQNVAPGGTVQLAGSVNRTDLGVSWSAPSGSFNDASLGNAIFTAPNIAGDIILTLTTADPADACESKNDRLTIHVNKPVVPTVIINASCYGSPASLSAIAPGGVYRWYDPGSGTLLHTGPNFDTPPLMAPATYYVETTVAGVTSDRAAVSITPTPTPTMPVVSGVLAVCNGSAATLTASGSAGTYQWYDAAVGGSLQAVDADFHPVVTANVTYYVQTTVGSCVSERTAVNLTVKPVPMVTSDNTGAVCSGTAQNYTITGDLPGTTFTWSRAQAADISNGPVTDQAGPAIEEILVNTSVTDKTVTYVITPMFDGCAGTPFNYVVTVYPSPGITSDAAIVVCNGEAVNYVTQISPAPSGFSWSRSEVPGISNNTITGQASTTIREVLHNITNTPIDVYYVFNYSTLNCAGTFTLKVTVDPTVHVNSPQFNMICSGEPQNYQITSDAAGVTYAWSRAAVADISNPAVSGQTSNMITESLVNTSDHQVQVYYSIVPYYNSCPGVPFPYLVIVNPRPAQPIVNSNTPVCTGKTITLQTAIVTGATYAWTGPNGFTSSDQNPVISNVTAAATGTYFLTVTVNGCSSPAGQADIVVNQLPVANAGNDQSVCPAATEVDLDGNVQGGAGGETITGFWHTTTGTGTFSSINDLHAKYFPSAQDKTNGSVIILLTSTNTDDCTPVTDEMKITFELLHATDAGSDRDVCNQDNTVQLNGQMITPGGTVWSTSGSGTFNQPDQLNAIYSPSAADIQAGTVKLVLTSLNADPCYIPSDEITLNFLPPPSVDAGEVKFTLKGRPVTLTPRVSDDHVTYKWIPATGLSNDAIKNPVVTGDVDITYTLTIANSLGCVSSDQVMVKVIPEIIIPNTFTPNADGVNDLWEIKGMAAYPDAVVDIFNRNGQKVFHSIGYSKPWDGTNGGKELPFGTYYYTIDAGLYQQRFSGYITIVR